MCYERLVILPEHRNAGTMCYERLVILQEHRNGLVSYQVDEVKVPYNNASVIKK